MSEGLFWLLLSLMLGLGQLARVGLLMASFGASAATVSAAAWLTPISLEQQLHLFLLISGALLIAHRLQRRQRRRRTTSTSVQGV